VLLSALQEYHIRIRMAHFPFSESKKGIVCLVTEAAMYLL